MRKFFKPWRRKVGMVTLVMACGFMVGWVRSTSNCDVIAIRRNKSEVILISSRHNLSFLNCVNTPGRPKVLLPEETSFPEYYAVSLGQSDIFVDSDIDWRWRFFGFGIGEASEIAANHGRNTYSICPYWSIVIPLTALSAFLLLSKPRPSTQKKVTEPIPDEAGGVTS